MPAYAQEKQPLKPEEEISSDEYSLRSLYSKGKVSKAFSLKEESDDKEKAKDSKEKQQEEDKKQQEVKNKDIPDADEKRSKAVDYANLPYKGSLMYDERSLNALYSFLQGNVAEFSNDESLLSSFDELPSIAPAFFLNSVIFISPSEWSVWVDNSKFRPNIGGEQITAEKVDKEFAVFKWKPKKLDYISPNWQANLVAADIAKNKLVKDRQGLISKDGNIFVDAINNEVYFRLAPNQTFVSRTMEIAEGYKDDFTIPTQSNLGFTEQLDIKQGQ